ncbi:purple acid phosphatase family protein [Streptomyces cylindrosporus]|uniref:Metallophosphoesterase family protein n=1 Tax=Streptomyces cylindrosporus TaxID=2927583 RepID=A0ABS9Y9M9_9ACTN|nr:metallophosphoesterase family protein [Streptomyces cylindrosporus]MCI3273933.1 metallophosphoesterase family protein [Streptomyces cylindrosporus]
MTAQAGTTDEASQGASEGVGKGVSRRHALGLLGTAGAGAAIPPVLAAGAAQAAPLGAPAFHITPDSAGAPPVQGLHLTFGADPSSQMTVSWITDKPVNRPVVHYGTLEHGFGSSAKARTVTYVDGTSSRTVYVHHAALNRLAPGTDYLYFAGHEGTTPDGGTFRTAPRGRQPFTFTSFGDQSAPQVTWAADGTVGLDANSTPATKDIVTGIEQVAPLFHLLNGDLCYANLDVDRVRTWNNFFANNSRSARFRPWMPAAGNHEIEKANGPLGLGAYQSYFTLPSTETDAELAGLWYAFTAGSVRVIVLQNDDNCLQDGGDIYISGYSGGRQLAFLEKELRAARASRDIDWIVVAMHQVMISSSDANGADLGLRQKYGPLFDRYGVDLVVCGHEHNYERSLAVRGVVSGSETLTPNPVSQATDSIDTGLGTVHMVLGGGGVSGTTNQKFFTDGSAKVITAVSATPGSNGKRTSTYTKEQAVWSGVRDVEHPYGFAAFTVDPGRHAGDTTRMHVTYYNVNKPHGELSVFETFTLHRKRSDGKA